MVLSSFGTSRGEPPEARSTPASENHLPSSAVSLRPSGCTCRRCSIAETASFRIHWCAPESAVTDLAAQCEALQSRITAVWLPENAGSRWTPRCEIVVHQNAATYMRQLGRGSEQTSG